MKKLIIVQIVLSRQGLGNPVFSKCFGLHYALLLTILLEENEREPRCLPMFKMLTFSHGQKKKPSHLVTRGPKRPTTD